LEQLPYEKGEILEIHPYKMFFIIPLAAAIVLFYFIKNARRKKLKSRRMPMWSLPHKDIYVLECHMWSIPHKAIYVLECHIGSISHNAIYVIDGDNLRKRRIFHNKLL